MEREADAEPPELYPVGGAIGNHILQLRHLQSLALHHKLRLLHSRVLPPLQHPRHASLDSHPHLNQPQTLAQTEYFQVQVPDLELLTDAMMLQAASSTTYYIQHQSKIDDASIQCSS